MPALGEGVLVSVNDDIISSYDLKQRMLLLMATSGVQVTQDNYAQFQSQALRSLVDEHLQEQEMKHWKVTVEDKEVDDELSRMAQQSNLTKDQLLGELKKMRRQSRRPCATRFAPNSAGTNWSAAAITPMPRSAATRSTPPWTRSSPTVKSFANMKCPEIFLDPTTAGGIDAARKEAPQQLSEQLSQKVAPFQAVARQFSNAPSAANGGDEGWLVSGSMDPQIEATLKTMKVGDISAPVETKDGVYIFYLRDKSDGNSDEVVRVTQASVPLPAGASAQQIAAAQLQLAAFKSRADSCNAVTDLGKKAAGVTVEDLGEIQVVGYAAGFCHGAAPAQEQPGPPRRCRTAAR